MMLKILIVILFFSITAWAKPTLTIYTYDAFSASWGPAPKIKALFETEHNCTLKFVATSSSIGALRKIQLEGKNTKADILLGLDTSMAQVANKTGLFAYHNINSSMLDLPTHYNDKSFVPFDYSYFAFVYDSEKLKNPPNSFEELASMPKDFKIVIQDPRSSTSGLGLLLWVKEVYGDKASDYWEKLSPHILTITKGWSEAYGLFLKGEADMVLSYTTSPAYHIMDENKTNYKSANFSEGHYAQIEVAAMLKSSQNQALGKKFLAFLLSEQFAEIIPTANWAYPVIKIETLPKAFDSLSVPKKVFLWSGKKVQKRRKEIINEWLESLQK
ncbi:MAG TPA: thiamine ABC transporter substrate binding subunit [Campylobacterales bacterium]|nr:thiamine ABC transporter substrate binding subunit [Campylobacterales bacterium]